VSRLRVNLNRQCCIGSGACVEEAPKLFARDENGVVVLRVTEIAQADQPALRCAAVACPAAVIEIEEEGERT
jgi:ferredoxin